MDLIEKYDRLRIVFIKRFVIFFMIWHGTFTYTFNFQIDIKFARITIISIELIAFLIWAIYLIKLILLFQKIKEDKVISNALDNELYKQYKLKSAYAALIAFIVSVGISIGLITLIQIPVVLILQILLFIVISTFIISNLIFLKK